MEDLLRQMLDFITIEFTAMLTAALSLHSFVLYFIGSMIYVPLLFTVIPLPGTRVFNISN
jgi:hypothetical protein